ncbi:uncharacterized protein [Miscanthus floridulus]|uniref:uncharacterized protein isoform X1 n=2 Tax=Miscanthus floridulus TaxID=154761 RepID=UPI003459376A
MENRKEEQQGAAVGWMTVPAFGEWDVKNGAVPDYSMDFSKIREMRKQNKRELSRASLGGDEDLLQQQQQSSKAQPPNSAAPHLEATAAVVTSSTGAPSTHPPPGITTEEVQRPADNDGEAVRSSLPPLLGWRR